MVATDWRTAMKKISVVVILLSISLLICAQPPTRRSVTTVAGTLPVGVKDVLGCVLPVDQHFSLTYLGTRDPGNLVFRYFVGPIPKTGDDQQPYRFIEIVLYNKRQSRSVVTIAVFKDQTVAIDRSPFFLRRTASGWEVRDGPLGGSTWDSVGQFVDRLQESTPIQVRSVKQLSGGSSNCVDGRF
jgi:hypothetical protein